VNLHDRVVRILDEARPENGLIVMKDGRVLATRDPAPDGGAYIVVLDVDPHPFALSRT
jgi:hypothetical protein